MPGPVLGPIIDTVRSPQLAPPLDRGHHLVDQVRPTGRDEGELGHCRLHCCLVPDDSDRKHAGAGMQRDVCVLVGREGSTTWHHGSRRVAASRPASPSAHFAPIPGACQRPGAPLRPSRRRRAGGPG